MPYARLSNLLSSRAAAVGAVLLLSAATALLEMYNPKKDIEGRFDLRFCVPGRETPPRDCSVAPNPYFSTDSSFGFAPQRLYRMLDAYCAEDRKDHTRFILYDFAYPFAYAIPFAVLILWLQRELSPPKAEPVRWLFLIPLAAALSDLFENAGMLYILKAGVGTSNRQDWVVYFTAAANVLKWVFACVAVALIFSGLVGVMLRAAYKFKPEG